jgi:hypothetical protein
MRATLSLSVSIAWEIAAFSLVRFFGPWKHHPLNIVQCLFGQGI